MRGWCVWSVLATCAAASMVAPMQSFRCSPTSDSKVMCECVDWTTRQRCTALITIRSKLECDAVGGVWRSGFGSNDPYSALVGAATGRCEGDWNAKESYDEALAVHDTVLEVRAANPPPQQRPPVPPFGGLEIRRSGHVIGVAMRNATGGSPNPTDNDDPNKVRDIVVSPSYGPTSGGIWVQIMGAGSYHTPNSLQCKLDLVEQFCYSNHYFYTWCYLTPKCAGVYPLKCHNGPLQFEGKYAVVAKTPWITSVYPFSGDTSGGTEVTVRGWNFEPHCPSQLLCRFGSVVTKAKYYTSSSIMCVAPCGSKGFVSVEVSNDGGAHWSMSGVQYAYVGDPVSQDSTECQRYRVALESQ